MQQAHNHPFSNIVLDRLVLAQTHALWSPSAYLTIHPGSIHMHALQFSWVGFGGQRKMKTMYNEYVLYKSVSDLCTYCSYYRPEMCGKLYLQLNRMQWTQPELLCRELLWLCSSCWSYIALLEHIQHELITVAPLRGLVRKGQPRKWTGRHLSSLSSEGGRCA